MKSKTIITIFILFYFTLNSCDKDKYIDIPDTETMPVVNCIFSPDSAWTFQVYELMPIYDYTSFQFLKEIAPVIKKNNNILGSLYYTSEIRTKLIDNYYLFEYYTNSNLSISENNNYSFEFINNNKKITGNSYIPKKPDVSTINLTSCSLTKSDWGGYGIDANVELTLNTNNISKYYMIKLSYLADFYGFPGYYDTIRNEIISFEINADYSFRAVNENEGWVIDGSNFSQKKTINILIDYILDIEYYTPDKFFIEVRSITEDYYLYQKTLYQQSQTLNDPFSEPVSVHTNINNGLGIFTGYNFIKDTVYFLKSEKQTKIF